MANLDFSSDTSKALKWSLVIHSALAIVVVSFSLVAKAFERPVPLPHIFELQGVKGPQHIGAPGRLAGDSRLERTDKAADLSLPKPEKGQHSNAKASDAKASKADANSAKSKSDKPKLVSYDEFMKQNGKSASGKSSSGRKQNASSGKKNTKIDASGVVSDLRKNLAWGDDGVGGGGAVGGTGVTSGEMDELALYFQRVRALIDSNFDEPKGILEQVSTMVQFTIQSNGVVTGASVVSSSGSDEFDKAALDAVTALGTLDPPPGNKSYTRKIEFVGKQGE